MFQSISELFCQLEEAPHDLSTPLPSSPGVRDILHRAMVLSQLNDVFLSHLPQELAAHCHLLNVTDQCLVVAADTGARAAQFKMQMNDLLEQLQKQACFSTIGSIKCLVRPRDLNSDWD